VRGEGQARHRKTGRRGEVLEEERQGESGAPALGTEDGGGRATRRSSRPPPADHQRLKTGLFRRGRVDEWVYRYRNLNVLFNLIFSIILPLFQNCHFGFSRYNLLCHTPIYTSKMYVRQARILKNKTF
jgi:hypothetical protein